MNSQPSALADHIGFWLRALSNTVSDAFAARLARHDISVPQWVVLRLLYNREGASLRELAQAVDTDKGAMSRMIERLVRKHLLTRADAANDRRTLELRLTPAGRRLVPLLAREADRNDQAFFKPLPPQQRREMLRSIQHLLRAHRAMPNLHENAHAGSRGKVPTR